MNSAQDKNKERLFNIQKQRKNKREQFYSQNYRRLSYGCNRFHTRYKMSYMHSVIYILVHFYSCCSLWIRQHFPYLGYFFQSYLVNEYRIRKWVIMLYADRQHTQNMGLCRILLHLIFVSIFFLSKIIYICERP